MDPSALLEQWLTWLELFWAEAAQLLLYAFLNTPIISIPIMVVATTLITIAWADKLPSLPIHISRWKLIVGKQAVHKWQAELVAENIEQSLGKILTHPGELLEEIGQEPLAQQARHSLEPHIEEYIDEVMSTDFSLVWENLPPIMKRRTYRRAKEGLPTFIDDLIEDVSRHSGSMISYRKLTHSILHEQPLETERFFRSEQLYDRAEITRRSIGIGLCLSSPVMMLWLLGAPIATVLLLELLVIFASIYFTLFSIYRPLGRRDYGRLKVRNIISYSRKEIIEQQAELIAFHVLKLNHIVRHLFSGSNVPLTQKLIRKHLHPLIETFFTKIVIQIFFGLSGFLRLKKQAAEKVALLADYPFEDRQFQLERSTAQKKLIANRLACLPEQDLSKLIKPFAIYQRTKTLLCCSITGVIMMGFQWYILV